MIATIILSVILVLLGILYYHLILKPKTLIRFYKKTFEPHFKVFLHPFTSLKPSEFVQVEKDQINHKDCFKFMKQVGSQFDLVISNIANRVQLNLVSPKLMQAFHEIDQERYYRKHELIINGLRRMVGNGVTFASGDIWKMKRRVTTKMLNFTYIRGLVPKIYKIVKAKIDQIAKEEKADENGFIQFDPLRLTTKIASTVILQLFFGGGQINVDELRIQDHSVNHHFRKLFYLLEQQIISNPLAVLLGANYTKLGVTKLDREINSLLTSFNQFTLHYTSKRLEELKILYQKGRQLPQVYTDLIEAFYVQEILKKKADITPQFIQSLVDDFSTLYVAGTDTTSHHALMSIYFTFTHPQARDELFNQIKKNIPNFEEITYQSFKNCTILEATLTETLRAYSSANGIFPREAIEDHYLNIGTDIKIPIKKGTLVNTQTVTTQYKESIYKNAQAFDPHRFIDKEGKLISPEPFTLMNFSGGHRSCIGKQLAMTEMRVILSTVANFYEIRIEDSNKEMAFKGFASNLENVQFYLRPLKQQ